MNEAVTADKRNEYVTFYLTRSPYCLSTLKPDLEAQADYSIVDLFRVEDERSRSRRPLWMPYWTACTLNASTTTSQVD